MPLQTKANLKESPVMTLKEALAQLKSLATKEWLRSILKTESVKNNQFGVKMGDIRNVAQKIKTDHKLALELWNTKKY